MNRLAQIGLLGFIALAVVFAVIFIAVWGFVFRPENELTNQAVGALIGGVGAIIVVAVGALKGTGGGNAGGNGGNGGGP